jgi:hypothetical protein
MYARWVSSAVCPRRAASCVGSAPFSAAAALDDRAGHAGAPPCSEVLDC